MNLLLKVALFLRRTCLSEKFTSTQKVILFTIAGRTAGKNKHCWEKQYNLALECQISPRQFRREMQKLIDKNLIKVQRKPTSKGLQLFYCLDVNEVTNRAIIAAKLEEASGHLCPVEETTTGHPCPVGGGGTGHQCPDGTLEKTPGSPVAVELAAVADALKDKIKQSLNKDIKEKIKKEKFVAKREIDKTSYDSIQVPEWLLEAGWQDFEHHRQNGKSPMNANTKRLVINRLTKFKSQGQDVHEIMEVSIMSGWTGVFPLKGGRNYANGQGSGALTHRQATTKRAWDCINNPSNWLPDDGLPQVVA